LYGGLACLLAGLCLPFMTVRRFTDDGDEAPGFDGMMEKLFQEVVELFVFGGETSKSVLGGVGLLWAKGYVAIALLILFVSVVFPLAKLATSIVLVEVGGRVRGRVRWLLERFGPWSLLDATLVALLVIASQKFPLGTTIGPAVGFYFFLVAVVLSTVGVMLAPGDELLKPNKAEQEAAAGTMIACGQVPGVSQGCGPIAEPGAAPDRGGM
jgi:uncharacterized paraquat-inducible protein A